MQGRRGYSSSLTKENAAACEEGYGVGADKTSQRHILTYFLQFLRCVRRAKQIETHARETQDARARAHTHTRRAIT